MELKQYLKENNFPCKNNKLILLLHGYKQNKSYMEKKFKKLFNLENFDIYAINGPSQISGLEYSWFDLKNNKSNKEEEILESLFYLKSVIDQCKHNNQFLEKIYLIGFSQGAFMATQMGFLFDGVEIFSLSGRISTILPNFKTPQVPQYEMRILHDQPQNKIHLFHGKEDRTIPFLQHSANLNILQNYFITSETVYDKLGHRVSDIMADDVYKKISTHIEPGCLNIANL